MKSAADSKAARPTQPRHRGLSAGEHRENENQDAGKGRETFTDADLFRKVSDRVSAMKRKYAEALGNFDGTNKNGY